MGGGCSGQAQTYRAQPQQPAPIAATPKKSVAQLRSEAQEELGIDTVNDYNIAFAGGTKNGKSTLINAMRHVKKGQSGFAETGIFETTMKIASHRFPDKPEFEVFKHAVFWDIPGGGTSKFTAEDYSEKQKLYAFDFVIILAGETLTENDINFAKAVFSFNVPFAFVRSKCDMSLKNMIEEDDDAVITKDIKKEFRRKGEAVFRDQFNKYRELRDAKVFFISGPVIAGRPGYSKYRLDEFELFRNVLQKVIARRNPDEQQEQFSEYLLRVVGFLGLKFRRNNPADYCGDSDVGE